jgi:hypothetical protein
MSSLEDRKKIGLAQKLDALDVEFQEWVDCTSTRAYEKHHTQVLAITGHLKGLRTATREILDDPNEDILSKARNVESLVLGIRRIWEFFRSKLVQRRDEQMHAFLQLADELAWACYKPVLDRTQALGKRQPPLVFLNGGLSPYALSRDQAFPAEEVTGEPLGGPYLRSNPRASAHCGDRGAVLSGIFHAGPAGGRARNRTHGRARVWIAQGRRRKYQHRAFKPIAEGAYRALDSLVERGVC